MQRRLSIRTSQPFSAAATTTLVASSLSDTQRAIRHHHQYRQERNNKLLNQRHRYSRTWALTHGQNENKTTTGHELEAFENFARYRFDAREEPTLDLATNDLNLLAPRERFVAITGMLERKGMVANDGEGVMSRIRLTVLAAECFEELCHDEDKTIDELGRDDQYMLRNCMRQVLNLVQRARHDHPDAIAAAMRCVQIATNVRDDEERRFLISRTRTFVNEMQDGPMPSLAKQVSVRDRLALHLQPPVGRRDSPDDPPLRVFPANLENVNHHANRHQAARNANDDSSNLQRISRTLSKAVDCMPALRELPPPGSD